MTPSHTLHILEDLEPFPDTPNVGDVFSASTFWVHAGPAVLPAAIVTTVSARIEDIDVGGRTERVAHLGDGVTTMIPPVSGIATGTDVTVTGCLMWDRYLWTDYHTTTTGYFRLLRRTLLTRDHIQYPSPTSGWGSDLASPRKASSGNTIASEHYHAYTALEVAIESPPR